MKISVKKRILALVLTVFMLAGFVPVMRVSAYADVSLTVNVKDEAGTPVSGATVALGDASGETDNTGKVSLSVPEGNYVLAVSKTGYGDYSTAVIIDASTTSPIDVQISITGDTWKSFFQATNPVYSGALQALIKVSKDIPSGTKVEYSVTSKPEGANVDTTGIPKGDIPGEYTVHVNAQYNSVTKVDADYKCAINKGDKRIIDYNDSTLKEKFANYVASATEESGYKFDDTYLINSFTLADFTNGDYSAAAGSHHVDYGQGRLDVDGAAGTKNKSNVTIGESSGTVTLVNPSDGKATLPGVYYVKAYANDTTTKYYQDSATKLINFIVVHENQNSGKTNLLSFDSEFSGDDVVYEYVTGDKLEGKTVSKQYDDDYGTVTYSIAREGAAADEVANEISVNQATGELTIVNLSKVFKNYKNYGTEDKKDEYVKYTITATKTAGKINYGSASTAITGFCRSVVIGEQELYGTATATYELRIRPVEFTSSEVFASYSLTGNKVNGWYVPAKDEENVLTLDTTDTVKYSFSKAITGDYSASLTFTKSEGDGEKSIYIWDKTNNKISKQTYVTDDSSGTRVKIDATAPEATIQYSGAKWYKVVEEVVTLGVSKAGINVKIEAKDSSSGVATVKWWFDGDSGLYLDEAGKTKVPTEVPTKEGDPGYIKNKDGEQNLDCEFELQIKTSLLSELKQYKGAVKAVVTDRAGNETSEFSKYTVYTKDKESKEADEDVNVVVDNLNPVLDAGSNCGIDSTIIESSTDDTAYIKESASSVDIIIKVTEANFEADDVVLLVDGSDKTSSLVWKDSDAKIKTPTAGGAKDETYFGYFTITGAGSHGYSLTLADKAGNLLSSKDGVYDDGKYTSKTIVIDNTAPVVSVTVDSSQFSNTDNDNKWYTNKNEGTFKYKIEITEVNFDPDKVTYSYKLDGAEVFGKVNDVTEIKSSGDNKYEAVFEVSGDGDYSAFKVVCTDKSGSAGDDTYNRVLCIDTVNPQVSVSYEDGLETQYYNTFTAENPRKATVTVTEKNFDTDAYPAAEVLKLITAQNIAGTAVTGTVTVGTWENDTKADTYKVVVEFAGEANYVFTPDFIDLAKNEAEKEEFESTFTIDVTSPRADGKDAGTIGIEYNIKDANQGTQRGVDSETGIRGFITDILKGISFGYWKDNVKITVTVYDDTAGAGGKDAVSYTYTRAQTQTEDGKTVYVSDINTETASGTATLKQDETEKNKFTGTIEIPKDFVSAKDGQLDGTLDVELTDQCGNESKDENTQKVRVVYDTISPELGVGFAPVVNVAGGNTYFAGDITGTVNVTEANFFNDQLAITGKSSDVTWTSSSANSHTGTFTITGDGKHTVTISGTDYAGNPVSYTSGTMIIDTEIEAPEITVNDEDCNGRSYKDAAELAVSYFDMNFSTIDIKVTRTQMGSKDVDVTSKVITTTPEVTETGGSYFADDFEKIRSNDGIYTVTATMTDLANHVSVKKSVFSVNRFGSVYEFSDYLTDLVQDDGQYVQYVEEDLKIREINPDKLKEGSTKVTMTCDGKPVDNVKFTVSPVANDKVKVGDSGWYEYLYTISKDNFNEDGLYKITVTSQDAAGNKSENGKYQNMTIQFYVDSTPPELTSVTGLEEAIVNAESLDIDYAVFDTFGLQNVTVYLDGEIQSDVDEFEDMNYYEDGFTIQESNNARRIRIVAEDLAGNITDTDSEDFESAFVMNRTVTVSTNLFVRFYANKPLFFGVVGGIVFAVAAVGIAVPAVRKAKLKKKDKSDSEK